jgi:hypothetical protein
VEIAFPESDRRGILTYFPTTGDRFCHKEKLPDC